MNYSFTNRTIDFNNLQNTCKTKSGKLISGVGEDEVGRGGGSNKKGGSGAVRQKIKKLISGGTIIWKWRVPR